MIVKCVENLPNLACKGENTEEEQHRMRVGYLPAVSAVYGNSEVSMVYLGQPLDG